MSAIPLFDILSRRQSDHTAQASGNDKSRLLEVAIMLVEAALADYERLRTYETHVRLRRGENEELFDLELTRSIWQMFSEWASEAEHILERVRRLIASGHSVPRVNELDHAHGVTMARLSLSPESLARSYEQVKRGETIPIQELRDELRARRGK